jgi:flagellar motor switch protein FliN/FliY
MTHFDEALESPEWAFALAATLEQELGDDRILTVGTARAGLDDLVSGRPASAVELPFATTDGERGSLALLAFPAFAEALQNVAADETLLAACIPAFAAAVDVIAEQVFAEINAETAEDVEPDVLSAETAEAESVYPLLDGSALLGVVVLRVGRISSTADGSSAAPPTGVAEPAPNGVGTVPDPGGAPYVLADVEMGVTAELGRCRMTVRELLSITPGALIDLDRPAGAPVDVLVNGTLIARGEVVVIDEEFGIRISELVAHPAAAR